MKDNTNTIEHRREKGNKKGNGGKKYNDKATTRLGPRGNTLSVSFHWGKRLIFSEMLSSLSRVYVRHMRFPRVSITFLQHLFFRAVTTLVA